jgi:hypothetical protein
LSTCHVLACGKPMTISLVRLTKRAQPSSVEREQSTSSLGPNRLKDNEET